MFVQVRAKTTANVFADRQGVYRGSERPCSRNSIRHGERISCECTTKSALFRFGTGFRGDVGQIIIAGREVLTDRIGPAFIGLHCASNFVEGQVMTDRRVNLFFRGTDGFSASAESVEHNFSPKELRGFNEIT